MRAWPDPHSVADGILDDETYDWIADVDAMRASGGRPIVAAEADIVRAHELAIAAGFDVSATGSAGLAGVLTRAPHELAARRALGRRDVRRGTLTRDGRCDRRRIRRPHDRRLVADRHRRHRRRSPGSGCRAVTPTSPICCATPTGSELVIRRPPQGELLPEGARHVARVPDHQGSVADRRARSPSRSPTATTGPSPRRTST